jgi:epoxyqueuosine reductase
MDLRSGIGDWLFGCDICQEVCPWNGRAPESELPEFAPQSENHPIDLIALFDLDDAGFRERFRHTPLWRPKRRGLLRNAASVLGNHPTLAAVAALARGLHDVEPLVRGASAWALGHYATEVARPPLESRLKIETDADVLREIEEALGIRLA